MSRILLAITNNAEAVALRGLRGKAEGQDFLDLDWNRGIAAANERNGIFIGEDFTMLTSLTSESVITAVGLVCELAGFLIMTKDIFLLRSLGKIIKDTTIRKDDIYANTAVECYTVNEKAAAAASSIALLFLTLRVLLSVDKDSDEFREAFRTYFTLLDGFKTITDRDKADAAQMTANITTLTDNLKNKNNAFRNAIEEADRVSLHFVKLGMGLVIVGAVLEIVGQIVPKFLTAH